jgi:large subunit ribosomal protein L7Ae
MLVCCGSPRHIKYGLNHITYLVENQKAGLVAIASDVDPIEVRACLATVPQATRVGAARVLRLRHALHCTAFVLCLPRTAPRAGDPWGPWGWGVSRHSCVPWRGRRLL